jgi:N-acetyl sugar amidotransferase
MDDSIPTITFDEHGVCNFCKQHDIWEKENPTDGKKLNKLIQTIKEDGKNKMYDCVVAISGGADSSYLLYLAKEVWKLNPLAFHFDNGWNTQIAKNNIQNMVDKLNVDYYTYSIDRPEFDDFCASFLKASVTDADIPNDIGMTASFYEVADTFDVSNVLIGHSFRTEGSMPLGWTYMDGKYIESVTQKFGTHKIKSFPNLWLKDWLYWLSIRQIKVLRPFWYINYNPDEAREFLTKNYGFEWYKSKHAENKYTKFIAYYYLYNKFHIDKRIVRLSAPVRSGYLTRDEAIETLSKPPVVEQEIIDEVKDRLHITSPNFDVIMSAPKHNYTDYETYHETFKRYKPLFWLMVKANLVPITFYKKYVEA